jgi:hypothetical protein
MSALSRLQPKCPLYGAGLVGYDAEGEYIIEDCKKRNIDATFI